MILNNKQITERGKAGLIKPFNVEMVQGASLDIRIGTKGLKRCSYHKDNNDFAPLDLTKTTENEPFFVEPNERILIESLENIYLPNDIAAQFILKSSVARRFFQHMFSGWCDPGWEGKLTMEFVNQDIEPYPIWVGKPIGQLIFHQTELVDHGYDGRYQGIFTVSPSK
jgi:dCTP deaminase